MKKILSITLSLLLVFAVIPMATLSVSADATAYEVANADELVAAFTDTSGCAVTLTADIVYTKSLTCKTGATSRLDLNGHTLTFTPENGTDSAITLPRNASSSTHFELLNSNTDTAATFNKNSTGYMVNNAPDNGSSKIYLLGPGTINANLTVTKHLVVGTPASASVPTINGNIDIIQYGLTIYSGIFNGTVHCSESINIEDTKADYAQSCVFNGNLSAANSITVNRLRSPTFNADVICNNRLSLTSGIINGSAVSCLTFYAKNYGANGPVSTSANTTVTTTDAIILSGTFGGAINAETISVTTGTFTGTAADLNATRSVLLLAGTYSYDPRTVANVAAKGEVVSNDDGTFLLTNYRPVELNGNYYASLNAAQVDAIAGDTIKLVDTYYTSLGSGYAFSVTKNDLTIDFNGQTLTDQTDKIQSGQSQLFFSSGNAITNFKITDSTYETTGGGKVILEGSDTKNRPLINNYFSAANTYNYTIENISITVTGGECTYRQVLANSGTAGANSVFKFKNTNIDWPRTPVATSYAVTGLDFIAAGLAIDIENCDFYANRNTINISGANTTLSIKDSRISAYKGAVLTISNKIVAKIVDTEFVSGGGYGVYIDRSCVADSPITFTGCKFTYTGSSNAISVSASASPDITLNNCSVTATTYTTPFSFGYGSTVNINGGTYAVADNVNSNTPFLEIGKGSTESLPSVVNIDGASFSRYYTLFNALTAYCTVNIKNATLLKRDASQAHATGSLNVVLANDAKIYSDSEMTTEIADFDWTSTDFMNYNSLYISSRAVALKANIVDENGNGLTSVDADENGKVVLPTAIDGYSKTIAGYTYGTDQKALANAEVTITEDTEFTVLGVAMTMTGGAQIRLDGNKNGIRFIAEITAADVTALEAAGFTIAEKGIRITRENSTHFADVVSRSNYYKTGEINQLAGSIVDILSNNLDKKFCGQGYLLISDGVNTYRAFATLNDNERSISYLGERAYTDRSATYSADYPNLTRDGDYSPYSQANLDYIYSNYKTDAWTNLD